jgi:hypothetical protein
MSVFRKIIKKNQRNFVDFDNLSDNLKCEVCLCVFYKPRIIKCGHIFCLDCLQKCKFRK